MIYLWEVSICYDGYWDVVATMGSREEAQSYADMLRARTGQLASVGRIEREQKTDGNTAQAQVN